MRGVKHTSARPQTAPSNATPTQRNANATQRNATHFARDGAPGAGGVRRCDGTALLLEELSRDAGVATLVLRIGVERRRRLARLPQVMPMRLYRARCHPQQARYTGLLQC